MNSGNDLKSDNTLPTWVWILLVIPVFLYPFLNRPRESNNALSGKVAPNLTFKTLDQRQVTLSDYRGKVVLLNFWASWCTPCMSEMESLKRLHETLEPKGFAVLAVNVEETEEHIASLPASTRATLPPLVFHSPDATEIAAYSVSSLPLSLLLGKDGQVIKIYYGSYRWDPRGLEKEFGHFLN